MTNARKARQRRREAVTYQSPSNATMNAKLENADVLGQHLWIMTAAWKISDPAKAQAAAKTREFDADNAYMLDAENLLALAGPGCYKCEKEYSPRLAASPCAGSSD